MTLMFRRAALLGTLMFAALPALALQPFVASYQAYNEGRRAGTATLQVLHNRDEQWRVDLGIRGNRGIAGLVGLDVEQSTVFDSLQDRFRPLSHSTVKRAFFGGRKVTGVYDWSARSSSWRGDLKKERRQPVPLREHDLSALLMNLAVVRDAQPGKELQYRVVENGRAREHEYAVAVDTETVAVHQMSYEAMRVSRTNGGNDETIFWIADGVPTPVRILQRENGADTIDLRLVEYQGVQSP